MKLAETRRGKRKGNEEKKEPKQTPKIDREIYLGRLPAIWFFS